MINKSRFLGEGAPCDTEEEALSFLQEVRNRSKDATHHCYAYILGANSGIMRYSDDGEPGGTAGLPMIEVMKAQGVTNACVVVTRWFGGVLLGAGGLVRAYARGASEALKACGVGTMHPTVRMLLEVGYPLGGRVDRFLTEAPVEIEEKTYLDRILYTLLIRARDERPFIEKTIDLTDGAAEPIHFEDLYHVWEEADATP